MGHQASSRADLLVRVLPALGPSMLALPLGIDLTDRSKVKLLFIDP